MAPRVLHCALSVFFLAVATASFGEGRTVLVGPGALQPGVGSKVDHTSSTIYLDSQKQEASSPDSSHKVATGVASRAAIHVAEAAPLLAGAWLLGRSLPAKPSVLQALKASVRKGRTSVLQALKASVRKGRTLSTAVAGVGEAAVQKGRTLKASVRKGRTSSIAVAGVGEAAVQAESKPVETSQAGGSSRYRFVGGCAGIAVLLTALATRGYRRRRPQRSAAELQPVTQQSLDNEQANLEKELEDFDLFDDKKKAVKRQMTPSFGHRGPGNAVFHRMMTVEDDTPRQQQRAATIEEELQLKTDFYRIGTDQAPPSPRLSARQTVQQAEQKTWLSALESERQRVQELRSQLSEVLPKD